MGCAVDKPSAVEGLYAAIAHDLEGSSDIRIFGVFLIDLHWGCLVGERADEAVPVTIFCEGDGDLCFNDGVDSSDLICDLPSALEEDRGRNVSFVVGHG